ncbi:ATP-binding cassette domain-containing protein [Paenibacillus donghaensis]|uniref:ABC transporter domain-containing protein n=1 Tax=Paenibacillus donghaensis TaxID=414771 RepID=A0A2Z2KG15_9BACL|nr:ABC transporter ATP-binding protein [Paenibacillus donghaensis]ASA22133.1 hypothetical protein B9T62_15900 [Paenibacillus donghaensis]
MEVQAGILQATHGSSVMELVQVTKIYSGVAVLEEISLKVKPGTATAVLGHNGSGKSTLLSVMAGLVQPTSGQLMRTMPGLSIGYAPEAFPAVRFTPEQYLRSMGRIRGMTPAAVEITMEKLLRDLDLKPFSNQPMPCFSKGMLQKVNLMQSLLTRPGLLLLDEPLSGLDAASMEACTELLLQLKQEGTAMMFSAHEPLLVEALADNVHLLQAGRTVEVMEAKAYLGLAASVSILCTGLTAEAHQQVQKLPGFIAMKPVVLQPGEKEMNLTFLGAVCDDTLRYLLGAGASIQSVQRHGSAGGTLVQQAERNMTGDGGR